MTIHLLLPLFLAGVLFLAVGVHQPVPFRIGVDLVPIYATVIDKDRRLVSGLSRDNFEVFDNGRSRPIAFFSNDIQPISIIVMLDRSSSMADHSDLVTAGVEEFLLKLLPSDRARIGTFSYEVIFDPPHFTSDNAQLLRALRHGLQGSGPSPVWTAVDQSLTAVVNEPGRRVVLLFTDGHDAPMRGQPRTHVSTVLRRAQLDDVMIYTIGVVVPDEPGSGGPASSFLRRGKSRPKLLMPDPNLRQLAALSGGGYFQIDWGADLKTTFARIADELHNQYILGFSPTTLDGNLHNINVKVRQPGASVRARKTYFAARGS